MSDVSDFDWEEFEAHGTAWKILDGHCNADEYRTEVNFTRAGGVA